MAIERIVRARFQGNDKLTKRFGIMERAAARFGRKTENAFKRVNKRGSRFKDITKGIVTGLGITSGLGMISRGIGSVATQFVAFDKAALGATVRFKDIGPEAADFDQKLKQIQKTARDAGQATKFTAAQAAEGLNFMAKAGFTSAEAMQGLNTMINLSIATGEEFEEVADRSSDLLGSFGLAADNTAEKIANLTRLNDVLAKSANTANVTTETMFETMKVAAPIGRTLGIELEELAAVTAVLGGSGIKGSKAATALKNAFLNLSTQKKPVVEMLDSIGVKIDDGTGNMRKFTDIMEDIGAATGEFGNLKVSKAFEALFGKLGIAGATNLIDQVGLVREFEESMKNAGGTAQATADIMGRSIEDKLLSLGSAATEAGFKIFSAFAVDGKQGIDALTQGIRDLDLSGVVFLLRETLNIFKSLFNVVSMLTKPFAFLAAKIAEINDVIDLTGFIGRGTDQLVSGAGNVMDFLNPFSGGGDRPPPNDAEAKARAQAQSVNVGGTINVNGPAGTTAESDGPVGFNLMDLGLNGA